MGEVKSHLSELLARVREDSLVVTITRHGRPVARLVPVDLLAPTPHLADAAGWLEDDDPFFTAVERVVASGSGHRPRRVNLGD